VQKIIYANSWENFFARSGLKSLDDFFDYSPVETIGINNKRSVVAFVLGPDSQKKHFFMKRFNRPHFKDMFFTWRSFGQACSQARCEWENAHLLLDNGIETYRPVCYGEKTKCGIENKSFIVTEKLQGIAMTDFVREKWHNLTREQKEIIIAGIGTFIHKIHALNISLPDLYIWHIFIKENTENKYEFAVIDLHRMSRNVTRKNIQIENLGRLHHSMTAKYFDEKLKRLLIESYATADMDIDVNTFTAWVTKQSDVVSARRNPKPY
jgi:tRNA A-37 threonylcarbamoyl transferase component Bud32